MTEYPGKKDDLLTANKEAGGASQENDCEDLPEWQLEDLYSSPQSDDLQQDLDRAKTESASFHTDFQGQLEKLADHGKGGEQLAKAVSRFEALNDLIGRIASYAGLLYAANSSDPDTAKFYGDIQEKVTTIGSKLLFFPLELNLINDDIIDGCCNSENLHRYAPWFENLRKEKPFQLEDRLEQLFYEKSVTGQGAWNRLFNETMTSLRFDVDGQELTLEPTLNLLTAQDETARRKASEALSQVFSDNLRLFTLLTNTLAKDKEISDRWRGFEDVADSRHLGNRVERDVVEALVEAVRESYPRISHRYYKLKAKWLGKDQLAHWDRNAPLPEGPSRTIPWHEARQTVLGAYQTFSPQMSSIAGRFFDQKWIDAPVREGKALGAFSHPTVPSAHPYILLNYQGKPRDVMTLAHELGHGVHQMLANEQGPLMAPTPLTLAETASVFGEMLTFKALLNGAHKPQERKALLASKVEDMINTVVRQIAFYCFEREVHTARRQGELTSEQLGIFWQNHQRESLGPGIHLGEGYKNFWCYIPHFIHSPFYVYAYAFGECLVNSLYSVYQDANEGFAKKYFDMLKAGGTKHHKDLLAPFGLDATDPGFWMKGLQVIERLIDELESLEDEIAGSSGAKK